MTLDEIQNAITARAAAIAKLGSSAPREQTIALIESGEAIRRNLQSLEQRLRLEARWLDELKAAHLSYLR
jgi:hypothetical protein